MLIDFDLACICHRHGHVLEDPGPSFTERLGEGAFQGGSSAAQVSAHGAGRSVISVQERAATRASACIVMSNGSRSLRWK